MDASLTTRSSPSTASTGPSNLTVSRRETDASSLTPVRVGPFNLADPLTLEDLTSSTVAQISGMDPSAILAEVFTKDVSGNTNSRRKRSAAAMASADSGSGKSKKSKRPKKSRKAKTSQATMPTLSSSQESGGDTVPAGSSSSNLVLASSGRVVSSEPWRLKVLMYPLSVSATWSEHMSCV